jgi:Predicted flavin-nucleotide-binding protein
MISELTKEQIENLLHEEIVGHLGCHADGKTYVVPISYAYDGEFIIAYTHEGMKIQMMRKNPNVCFQVDDKKNLDKWRSVVLWGQFEEVTNQDDRANALKALTNRNLPLISSETMHIGSTWPFTNINPNSLKGIMFRIRIQEKTGRFEESRKSPYYAT